MSTICSVNESAARTTGQPTSSITSNLYNDANLVAQQPASHQWAALTVALREGRKIKRFLIRQNIAYRFDLNYVVRTSEKTSVASSVVRYDPNA